jgi:hypothetical protein
LNELNDSFQSQALSAKVQGAAPKPAAVVAFVFNKVRWPCYLSVISMVSLLCACDEWQMGSEDFSRANGAYTVSHSGGMEKT